MRMTKAGLRRLLSLASSADVAAHGARTNSPTADRNRIASVVILALACFMLDGCATVKKLVPWGSSDKEPTAAAHSPDDAKEGSSNAAATMGSAEHGDGASTSESKSPEPDSHIDLSVPRVQHDQAAMSGQPNSETGTAHHSGRETTASASHRLPSADSTNIATAGADDWGLAVQQAIHRRWVQPRGPKIPTEFSCDVMVKLTPFGGVDDVKVVRSCGDVALDASIETAVRDASPLPIPKDPSDFSNTLLLTFTPR